MEQMRIGIDLNVAPLHIISIDYTDTFNIPTYDIYAILHLADISYAQLWQRVERKRLSVITCFSLSITIVSYLWCRIS